MVLLSSELKSLAPQIAHDKLSPKPNGSKTTVHTVYNGEVRSFSSTLRVLSNRLASRFLGQGHKGSPCLRPTLVTLQQIHVLYIYIY